MISFFSLLLVFMVALMFSFLFSGYETGFISTNPIRIRYMAEEEHVKRAVRFLQYASHPNRMLSMLLVGNNLCLIIGTMAISRMMQFLSERYSEVLAVIVMTPLFLIFGEVIPKSVFRTHPNRMSLALLPVIDFLYVLLMPFHLPITWATGFMLDRAGGEKHYLSPLMSSRDDVRVLVDESADHGTIEPEERKMIHSVINLQTKLAREIMVPRIDIQALPETATREELLALFEECGRTRIVIYQDSIDHVVGVVNAHALLVDMHPEDPGIQRFIREIPHVPDTVKVDDLFQLLKRMKQHMAVITDEYGGTDGLITVEDIIEEIFGQIQDEHDQEERTVVQVAPHAYVVDARASLEEVSEAIGVVLIDEEVDTIAGWVMRAAGRIPAQGEVCEVSGIQTTILEGTANQISKVRLEIREQTGEMNENQSSR